MDELKTLKDFTTKGLEFREKRTSEKLIEDLKAEAVKWIKQIDSHYVGTDDKNSEENIKHADAVKVWIKHFFFISDAELK